MRDTIHNEKYLVAIPPVVVADNTAQVGAWIDRSGFDSLSFAILTGTLADADATFTVLNAGSQTPSNSFRMLMRFAEEDSLSELSKAWPPATAPLRSRFAADNATTKIGYIGGKRRYVRIIGHAVNEQQRRTVGNGFGDPGSSQRSAAL